MHHLATPAQLTDKRHLNLFSSFESNIRSKYFIVLYFPFKGDALFWYNLFRNGTGDIRTQHASCPVIAGSKWGKLLLVFFLPYL